jgi:hypothetical protein
VLVKLQPHPHPALNHLIFAELSETEHLKTPQKSTYVASKDLLPWFGLRSLGVNSPSVVLEESPTSKGTPAY